MSPLAEVHIVQLTDEAQMVREMVRGFAEKELRPIAAEIDRDERFPQESIDKMLALGVKVGPGDFAENITTEGIDLVSLSIGTRISIGEDMLLEVTQIGKECHTPCAIYRQAGGCVMPTEGIFTRVICGGVAKVGDQLTVYQE